MLEVLHFHYAIALLFSMVGMCDVVENVPFYVYMTSRWLSAIIVLLVNLKEWYCLLSYFL